MHNFGTFFLWALAACILWQGSLAEDPRSVYMCFNDPIVSSCLTDLKPMLNQLVKAQDQRTRDAEAKLDRLDRQLQTKAEDSQAKLNKSLLAVQEKLEAKLQAVLKQLQAVSEKIDAAKVENQLQPISDKMEACQQADKLAAVPAAATNTIPSGYELIGSRYFRIVNEYGDWDTAKRRCREMGGYLASFQNAEEINAITPKLKAYHNYWLGINDRDKEGHFVSVASQKPAPFLKWAEGHPDVTNHEQNCVSLYNGEMSDIDCKTYAVYFICQADNET
ncbi:hypothetical protein KR059_011154 [Drosophila kikkawai]|nr:hypothetical protein KR059_011154 [Drosophila kikkawai]